ncbi:alkaline phosphatase, tissue-nonspecific isozyme-like [Oncorhynchus kisutch]|uniref:alkaline phosphatase, tissue-nonspecific isozyme-like n=1 Tax=Oncorhynchus kisutch TaxID=8019 RepID=UPI0009A01E44|nr:alkaline phosphatase, tissue-nonspecific isozyme-like [Oncorhynchus kisutch]
METVHRGPVSAGSFGFNHSQSPVTCTFTWRETPPWTRPLLRPQETPSASSTKSPSDSSSWCKGHHASRALHGTVAFDNDVAKGLELPNEEETLTLLTAGHSHAFTFNGYPFRGQSILGKSKLYGKDMLPYTTVMYGNGPGYKVVDNKRPASHKVDTKWKDYMQLSAVPMDTEFHGGEDVVVLARVPMAHLFHWVQEKSYLAYTGCVGWDLRHCEGRPQHTNRILITTTADDRNSAPSQVPSISLITALLAALLQ